MPKPALKFRVIGMAVILVYSVIIFSNTLNHEILYGWDDGEYIENADIQTFSLDKFFKEFYLGMYQPLAVASLSINYQISGLKPAGYHLTNLLIHLINVVLVFFLFQRITQRLEIILIVTLLFAIHPMHVEAVSWIATRSNGLYSMFYLGALVLYLKYLEKRSVKWLLYSFILFLLSCFSKSMAITLPALLLLFDYFHENRVSKKRWMEKIPFLIISILFGLVTINAAGEYGHIKNLELDYNFIDRIVLLIYSVIFYLVKAIAPANLSAVYAYPDKAGGILPWIYYFAVFLMIVLIYNVIKSGSWRKSLVFGLLFFLITISVVLPLVWSRMLMLADRYTYISYLGLFFISGKIYVKIADSKHRFFKSYRSYFAAGFVVYLLFLSITTFQRNKVWKNTETLVNDVIEKDRSDTDMAIGYFFRGNLRDRQQNYDAALQDFSRAIQLNPHYTMAYNNRGIIRGSTGDLEGALEDFTRAMELEPGYADARYNRGNVYYYLNQPDKACSDWKKADELGSIQAGKIYRKYCK